MRVTHNEWSGFKQKREWIQTEQNSNAQKREKIANANCLGKGDYSNAQKNGGNKQKKERMLLLKRKKKQKLWQDSQYRAKEGEQKPRRELRLRLLNRKGENKNLKVFLKK